MLQRHAQPNRLCYKTSFRESPISPFETLALCVGYQRLAISRQQAVSRQWNSSQQSETISKERFRLTNASCNR